MKYWTSLFFAISLTVALFYLCLQQNIRQSANDPQIQISNDISNLISNGKNLSEFNLAEKVDISKSLSSYFVVYDSVGNPILGSGVLDGKLPNLPNGIFDFVKKNGEDRVTWQPRSNVRSAIVVTKYEGKNNGFVMAGRSLSEIEKREDKLLAQVVIGWIVTIFFMNLPFLIFFDRKRKRG